MKTQLARAEAEARRAKNGRIPATMSEMFERHVLRSETGCWSWNGSHNPAGYGTARLACLQNKSILAHRLSWLVNVGPIPDGMHVLHACDNPGCVRHEPGHLFTGTNLDNIADRMAKGRPGSQVWKGKRPPNRVLSPEAIIDMIISHASGVSPAELGRRHNVTREHAWRVATRRVRHVV